MEIKKTRGRKAIEVNRDEFQNIISRIENTDDPPKNRTDLWKRVSETDWAIALKLSAQTAMNRAEKMDLEIKTNKGLRGKIKGSGPVKHDGIRKVKKYEPVGEAYIKEAFAPLGKKTINKVLKGNLKTAVKVFCYDCCGGIKKAVRECASYGCPLWIHRPWTEEKGNRYALTIADAHPMDDSQGHGGSPTD